MLSKSKEKFIRSLQLRKYRQKYHNIVVEGIKILNELIEEYPKSIVTICGQIDWYNEFEKSVPAGCEQIIVTEPEMKRLSSFKTPAPVLAVVDYSPELPSKDDPLRAMVLYLDAIRDPGNLGTIFRIADWFGIQTIFLSPDTVDPYNPKVIQSSMASVFRVKWARIDIEDLVSGTGMTVLAATLDGRPMHDIEGLEKGVLILGNESRGISQQALQFTTDSIAIPGGQRLGADSLNVAVAAGILCAHLRVV